MFWTSASFNFLFQENTISEQDAAFKSKATLYVFISEIRCNMPFQQTPNLKYEILNTHIEQTGDFSRYLTLYVYSVCLLTTKN